MLTLAGLVAPTAPLASAPLAAAAPSSWQSDWGDDSCSLIRAPDGPNAIRMSINSTPGDDAIWIRLVHKRWAWSSGTARDIELSLDPGGVVPAEAFYSQARVEGPVLALSVPGRVFLDQLAAARSLSVRQRGRPLASYTLPSAA
jgi:hypothetical protein